MQSGGGGMWCWINPIWYGRTHKTVHFTHTSGIDRDVCRFSVVLDIY